jgi:DNA invertase Pin-like site-specific DNA recombinase
VSQSTVLRGTGVEPEHLYQDQVSGKRDNRPGLEACLKALRQGETPGAWKFDWLGRDLSHLVNLVHNRTKRGVGLKVRLYHMVPKNDRFLRQAGALARLLVASVDDAGYKM